VTASVRELRIVYLPVATVGPGLQLGRPADAAAFLSKRLIHEPIEVGVVLLLDTKHRLIGVHEVSRGSLDACLMHPREVFKAAVLTNAAAIIVGHNHPSGDPTPSPDDVAICARLRNAAELLGISLLDFVIIGYGTYLSFTESGR
jgi:DNA repair protein RadC